MSPRPILLGSVLLGICGCGDFGDRAAPGVIDEVPDAVTYEQHVRQIMAVHCDLCHESAGTVSSDFVSSSYGDPSPGVQGVFSGRQRIIDRCVDEVPTRMPPAPYQALNEVERDVLLTWAAQGAPEK